MPIKYERHDRAAEVPNDAVAELQKKTAILPLKPGVGNGNRRSLQNQTHGKHHRAQLAIMQ